MTHPHLPYEQAKNEEYLEKLEEKLRRNPQLAVDRNVIWIDGASYLRKVVGALHPLIGRVGLDSEDEDLGRSFYIGPRRFDQDGIRVISWAAPRARDIWFQPDPDASGIAAQVVVRRTFSLRHGAISDLEDEVVREVATSPFADVEIAVPAPAGGTSRRRAVPRARAAPTEQGPEPLQEEPLEAARCGYPPSRRGVEFRHTASASTQALGRRPEARHARARDRPQAPVGATLGSARLGAADAPA